MWLLRTREEVGDDARSYRQDGTSVRVPLAVRSPGASRFQQSDPVGGVASEEMLRYDRRPRSLSQGVVLMAKSRKPAKTARSTSRAAVKSRPAARSRAATRSRSTARSRSAGKSRAAAGSRAPARTKKPSPIPPGYHSITPYLVCRGTAKAIAFYKAAFGAKERMRMEGPGGSVAHAEIVIGDSVVMMGDEMPEMGATAPETIGGTASGLLIYVKDVDRAYDKALAAGATSEMTPTDMFWGDRYCKLHDPFGHKWAIATHIEDLTPKEMARRGREAMAQQPPAGGGQT
jgi:PhnB protein